VEGTVQLEIVQYVFAELPKVCKISELGVLNIIGTKHAANVLSLTKVEEMQMLYSIILMDP
jgi:hypothetical protein